MGERLSLRTERIPDEDQDRDWDATHHARSMAERLERAFDAAAFAADLRGTAKSR